VSCQFRMNIGLGLSDLRWSGKSRLGEVSFQGSQATILSPECQWGFDPFAWGPESAREGEPPTEPFWMKSLGLHGWAPPSQVRDERKC